MEGKKKLQPDRKLKLMDQVRQVLRYHHYSYRIEKTYGNWIIRFLQFYHLKIHPRKMGKNEKDDLRRHLAWVKQLHDKDLAEGYGKTLLPPAL